MTSTVTDGKHVFTSGGYPKNHVSAVRADGSGKVVWENTTRVYVPSMLVRDGHLYAVQDGGVGRLLEERHRQGGRGRGRLGGTFFACPVRVGDHVFAINEAGRTYVFRATPDGFKVEAENQLGTEAYASPVVVRRPALPAGGDDRGRQAQEWVYCVGR